MLADERPRSGNLALLLGVAVPLGILAVAYALWAISDRLLYIGPLDRAQFGWLVVLPFMGLAPVGAGLTWQRLGTGGVLAAAGTLGAVLAVTAASLTWVSVASPDCEFGSRFSPSQMLPASAAIGLVFAGTVVIGGLIVTWFARHGHPWWGVLAGAAPGFGVLVATVAAFVAVMPLTGVCQRPL